MWHCNFPYIHTHIPLSPQFAMYPVQDPRLLSDQLVALRIHCTMKVEKDIFEAANSQDEYCRLLAGRIYQIYKVHVKYRLGKRMKMSVPKILEIYHCPVHSSAWKENIWSHACQYLLELECQCSHAGNDITQSFDSVQCCSAAMHWVKCQTHVNHCPTTINLSQPIWAMVLVTLGWFLHHSLSSGYWYCSCS